MLVCRTEPTKELPALNTKYGVFDLNWGLTIIVVSAGFPRTLLRTNNAFPRSDADIYDWRKHVHED